MNKSAGKEFENKIKDLLRSKFTGFKRYGAISGTLAGGGIGGTMGLMDAVKRDNAGEMEGMETKQKLKEYLKSMLAPGAAGMAGGAVLGTGAGELLRRLRVHQTMRGMQGDIGKALAGNKKIKYTPNQILERAASGYPEQNVLEHIGDKFKSILGKRANSLEIHQEKEKSALEKEATSFGATKDLLKSLRSQGVAVLRDPRKAADRIYKERAGEIDKGHLGRVIYRSRAGFFEPESKTILIGRNAHAVLPVNSRLDEYASNAARGSRLNHEVAPRDTVEMIRGKGGKSIGVGAGDLPAFREKFSSREMLFHEGGHAMHFIDDPYYVEHIRSGVEPVLAAERIANNNAINFMKQHNVPRANIDNYRKYTDKAYGAYLTEYSPESLSMGKYVPGNSLGAEVVSNAPAAPRNWLK